MVTSRVFLSSVCLLALQTAAARPPRFIVQQRMGLRHSRPSPETSMAAKSFVDKAIKDNKVIIFSKSYCPFCKKAKSAMGSVIPSDKFAVIELDQRSDTDSIQDYLLKLTGGRSVPRVFVDGEFIGGGDDTAHKAASGELKQLLASKGIL